MTNEERFSQALERIQRERALLNTQFESLSQAQLDFKPSSDSWSVGQVAHHVGLAEKMLQDNVRELLQAGRERRRVTRNVTFQDLPMRPRIIPGLLLAMEPVLLSFSIMNTFVPRPLQSFFLANSILKIKTAPALEPKAGMPREELLQYLRDARDSTLKLLEPAKSRDLSAYRWRHPLMGTHDIYGTLELMANHDRRHRMQMEEIQKSPNFPAC